MSKQMVAAQRFTLNDRGAARTFEKGEAIPAEVQDHWYVKANSADAVSVLKPGAPGFAEVAQATMEAIASGGAVSAAVAAGLRAELAEAQRANSDMAREVVQLRHDLRVAQEAAKAAGEHLQTLQEQLAEARAESDAMRIAAGPGEDGTETGDGGGAADNTGEQSDAAGDPPPPQDDAPPTKTAKPARPSKTKAA